MGGLKLGEMNQMVSFYNLFAYIFSFLHIQEF